MTGVLMIVGAGRSAVVLKWLRLDEEFGSDAPTHVVVDSGST
jgi:hypothetical protein